MGKLNNIIKEEFLNFIKEIKEHTDDEIIKSENIDLQHEYDKLNQQLFDNQLPKVPLKWSNRRTALGHVKALMNRVTGEIKIVHLAMSEFYGTTYRQFKNTLAHEMIHVKFLSTGKREYSTSHGFEFMREANRINSMGLGYNITDKNTEEIEMSDKSKQNIKPLIALILFIKGWGDKGKYYLSVTTPSVYAAEGDYFFNLFDKLVNFSHKYKSVEITVVESKNPNLMSYRIARSLRKSISYGLLSDKLLEELLNDRIIKNVKIESGKPPVISETQNVDSEWEEITII